MKSLALSVLLLLASCSPSQSQQVIGEPGEERRMAVFTHCGFYEIEFDGITWTPDSIERGAAPEGTGFNVTEGAISVVGEKLLFRADSGLEITFVPAPADLPPVPGCD